MTIPKRIVDAGRRRRKHDEEDMQAALTQWAHATYIPKTYWRIADYLIAIPNGGKRGPIEAKRLKAQGVKKGVSDLFMAYPCAGFHGLWLELKVKGGKLSDEQQAWQFAMKEAGYGAVVAWSFEEATDAMLKYLEGKI